MLKPDDLPNGRGSQEEVVCRMTNYAEAALAASAKDKNYPLHNLRGFTKDNMQVITHVRPMILTHWVDQWQTLQAANKRQGSFFPIILMSRKAKDATSMLPI